MGTLATQLGDFGNLLLQTSLLREPGLATAIVPITAPVPLVNEISDELSQKAGGD